MLIKPRNEILQEEIETFNYDEFKSGVMNVGMNGVPIPIRVGEPLSEKFKWGMKRYFRDENGLERFLNRVRGSYKHDKALMDENAGKLGNKYFIASLVIWGFYGIKVILYVLAWLSHPLTMFSSGATTKSCNYNTFFTIGQPTLVSTEISREKAPNLEIKVNGTYRNSRVYYGTNDIYAKDRDKIREASYILRRAIYKGSNNLNCLLVKSTYRKVGSEELLEAQALGEFSEPFLTQYITFGDKINNAIKVMLGSRIEMITKKEKTYLVVHNGNIPTLAEEIGKMFNEPVKIKVTSNE